MLEDGDRVLVALSGGKDSLMLTQLMAQQARIFKPRIQVAAAHVIMDNIPYESDRTYLAQFCQKQGIEFHLLHSHFDESTDRRKTRCFLCAWNRRKALFEFATTHGFNKIALGHHQDDLITTMLMNLSFEGTFSTMTPMLKMEHYPLSLIRPMCMMPEALIRQQAQEQGFAKQKTPCPYEDTTRRNDLQQLYQQIESMNPEARYSMWHAMIQANILQPHSEITQKTIQ